MTLLRFGAIRRLILLGLVGGFFITVINVVLFTQRAEAMPCTNLSMHCAERWWNWGKPKDSADPCKTPPSPQMPGSGLSGWIDSGPAKYDPNATKVYEKISYPPPWSTYDLGCVNTVIPSGATLDTEIGNWLKGVATTIIALCNSLHRLITPPTFMQAFNPLLVKATAALQNAIYKPYIGVALLLVGLGIIWTARKRNMAQAIETVTWALIVMAVATALFSWPVQAGNAVDSTATSVIGGINATVLGKPKAGIDPSNARADLLTDNVLYRQWLVGELGSSDSTVAKKYGKLLLLTQAYTYAEQAKIQADPTASDAITKKKNDDFQKLAQAVQHEDAGAYQHLKGTAGGRIGQGAVSVIAAFLTARFMIVADLILVVAFFIIRYAVILSPVLAVPGIFIAMRPWVMVIVRKVLGSVIYALLFAALAAVNTLAVGITLGTSINLPMPVAILICGVMSEILWRGSKPLRKLYGLTSARQTIRSSSRRTRIQRIMHRHRDHETAQALQRVADLLEQQNQTTSEPTRVVVIEMPENWSRPADPVTPETVQDNEVFVPAGDMPVGSDVPVSDDTPVESSIPEPIGDDQEPGYDPDFDPPAPYEPRHSDPVHADGGVQWRIWNPATDTYEVVADEMPDDTMGAPREEEVSETDA